MLDRFMFVLNSKSQDVFVDPYSVIAIEPAGKAQCHLIMDGGYVVRDIKTSPKDMAKRIQKAAKCETITATTGFTVEAGCSCKCAEVGDDGVGGPIGPVIDEMPMIERHEVSPPDAPITAPPKDTFETEIPVKTEPQQQGER